MEEKNAIGIFALGLILIVIFIPVLVAYLLYTIPKKMGYSKTGIGLSLLFVLFSSFLILREVFKDHTFTKSDAGELLAEEQIMLTDKFEIEENESGWDLHKGIHTFTLKISKKDKEEIVNQIKQSAGFMEYTSDETIPLLDDSSVDRYHGPVRMQNYANSKSFVRAYFKPNGQGFHPTYRTISIDKKQNRLFFFELN